jgi:hypothetical protein
MDDATEKDKRSRAAQFLASVPMIKPNPHVEEELHYHDKDHRIAHGHGADPQSSLVKLRTISTVISKYFVLFWLNSNAWKFAVSWTPTGLAAS